MTTETIKRIFDENARGAMAVVTVKDGEIHIRTHPIVWRYFVIGFFAPFRITCSPLTIWDFWRLTRRNLLVLIEVL